MAKKILIVDDEAPLRNILRKFLEKGGYEVFDAASGKEALGILEEEHIEVMFLDLLLPDTNGIELCRKIKEENPISVLYAMTAKTSLFELPDCIEAGFVDYFPKPLKREKILSAAQAAFERLGRWRGHEETER